MINLEYPFKNEEILFNKKSIKRQILNSRGNFIKKNVAILAGSTVNELADVIELFLLFNGIEPSFYISEYNKYYEEAVFENEKLDAFKPDIIFVFTSIKNINFNYDVNNSVDDINCILDNEFDKYKEIWNSLKSKYNAVIIQTNFEYPSYRILGNMDIYDLHGYSNFVIRLNDLFYKYARDNVIYILDLNYISAVYGLDKWHNSKLYALYKIAIDINAIPLIAFNFSNIVKAIYGKNKKGLVLDLDNTLWGGVIGEDGLSGVEIGKETAKGELYYDFQKYIRLLKAKGVLLNICSKNDDSVALQGINESDGVLKEDDFIIIKANWEPKYININNIASELNIGIDSLVFIDDNPFECDIVKNNCKGILVLNFDNIEKSLQLLDKSGYFETVNITEEDLKKNKIYKENYVRNVECKKFIDYNEYLKSLNMYAIIKPFENKYFERIAQLSNKSNQFNLTTKRYTVKEIETIANLNNYITLYGKLNDKFGDNGIVSIVIGKIEDNCLHIELFLMSCRVLKRNMEFAMMNELIRKAVGLGIKKIYGYYYKTEKNSMVKNLYVDFGFSIEEASEESTIYSLVNIEKYCYKTTFIEIYKEEN